MQGNNTDDIITVKHFTRFQNEFHGMLENGDDLGNALNVAFTHSLLIPLIGFTFAWFAFLVLLLTIIIRRYLQSRMEYQRVSLSEEYAPYVEQSEIDSNTFDSL